MPIVIDRKSGDVIAAPHVTEEDRVKLWETVLRAWCAQHPEELRAMAEGSNA